MNKRDFKIWCKNDLGIVLDIIKLFREGNLEKSGFPKNQNCRDSYPTFFSRNFITLPDVNS